MRFENVNAQFTLNGVVTSLTNIQVDSTNKFYYYDFNLT